MSLETIIIQFSYVAIFLLIYINGIISFPSSQIIYILAGWFAFQGHLNFTLVIIVGIFGSYLGNITLYELSRRNGMKYIKIIDSFFQKYYKLNIFSPTEIKKVQVVMKKKGLWYLFFGKLVNPIKIVINIPAGMSKINRLYFSIIILITSTIWCFAFTYLGFVFGKSFEFAAYYGLVMIILATIIILLFKKSMNAVVLEIEN